MRHLNKFIVLFLGTAFIACADGPVPTEGDIPSPLLGKGAVVQSVTGSGNFTDADGNFRTFSFTARRHADGTVDGQWQRVNHVNESETKAHGEVTCFTIEDSRARLGGFATSGLFSEPPDNEVAWRVADNGQVANSLPDQISLQFVGVAPGIVDLYCDGVFGDIPDLNDVEAGNIQVRP